MLNIKLVYRHILNLHNSNIKERDEKVTLIITEIYKHNRITQNYKLLISEGDVLMGTFINSLTKVIRM
jgi:hypothetical protein